MFDHSLFLSETKYLKTYFNIIDKHGLKTRERKYLEGHHIYPIFLYGKNSNIVYVTFRIHYLLHLLLLKHMKAVKHPLTSKAAFPINRMSGSIKNQHGGICHSKMFEVAKRAAADATTGENNPFYGKKHSEEVKSHLSNNRKGKKLSLAQREAIGRGSKLSWENSSPDRKAKLALFMSQRIISADTRKKISESRAGYKPTEETKIKIGIANKGKLVGLKRPAEFGAKLSAALKGRKFSEEHRNKINKNPEKIAKTAAKHRGMKRSAETCANISKAMLGKPSFNKGLVTYYDPETKEIFYFKKEDTNIPPHLKRGNPALAGKKKPRKTYYHPVTMDVQRIVIGDEIPEGYILGDPTRLGKTRNRK